MAIWPNLLAGSIYKSRCSASDGSCCAVGCGTAESFIAWSKSLVVLSTRQATIRKSLSCSPNHLYCTTVSAGTFGCIVRVIRLGRSDRRWSSSRFQIVQRSSVISRNVWSIWNQTCSLAERTSFSTTSFPRKTCLKCNHTHDIPNYISRGGC